MSKTPSFGLGGLAVALGIVTLGCGASGGSPRALPEESDGGVGSDAAAPQAPPVAPDETDWIPSAAPSENTAPGEPPDAAPLPADSGSPPGCVPEAGSDDPDEAFQDTNCDGIDGDVARAIFVATTGADDATGTQDAPVATLARGIELGAEYGKDVYVCNGHYAEQVVISKIAVRVYGGYACERAWKRVPDRAVIAPAVSPALRVERAGGEVVLERLAFRAPAATATGASSIAAVLLDSPGVTLTRVELDAADAGAGRAGAAGDPQWTAPPKASDASSTSNATPCSYSPEHGLRAGSGVGCSIVPRGASGQPRSCPGGVTTLGGFGGDGGNVGLQVPASPGGRGAPDAPWLGEDDAPAGAPGAHGAGATHGFGSLVNGIYEPDDSGTDGGPGAPGYAGRGGNGAPSFSGNGDTVRTFRIGGGGGQGGYPGCGGPGGGHGGGGGASIALVAHDTPVRLAWSVLFTGHGGRGGAGSSGGLGQPGGSGGSGGGGDNVVPGGNGHPGGSGGIGGTGGPGAGGPSIGIVHLGEKPELTDTLFVLGRPGLGASGERTAADGLSADVHEVAQ